MLEGLDTLVFDIQDIGCRFYTYISRCARRMEAAAERQLRFVVLDRPNPIGGDLVEGPVLDRDEPRLRRLPPIPVRHGMTVGELARMMRAEVRLRPRPPGRRAARAGAADLCFDAPGLPWVNPSPNMRSLTEAMLYPGIGLLETTNLSVGRGTDTPFEIVGAPWLDGAEPRRRP